MSQLFFHFSEKSVDTKNFSGENFVKLSQNSAAFNFLQQFFTQNNSGAKSIQNLILRGAKSSGKTHLLKMFAKKYQANFWQNGLEINPAQIFRPKHFYIIENIENFRDENLLLSLINSASESDSFLVMSAQFLPNFSLPDLKSRIQNIINCEIENPDSEAIKMLLLERFSRRQIKASPLIIEYIANNILRSYVAIDEVVKNCEIELFESGKNLSLNDVKNALSKLNF